MPRNKRQNWNIGDVFLVPTKDGKRVLGQIVGQEKQVLNSVTCAFFDVRVDSAMEVETTTEFSHEAIFSVLFVTRDLLDRGVWEVIGNRPLNIPMGLFPYERLRQAGFVGAKVIGSGIVGDFLNSFYGLAPWDDWHDPAYLDKLLISPSKKPQNVVLKRVV